MGSWRSFRARLIGRAGGAGLRLPRQLPGVTVGLGERLALAKRRDILGVLVTSVLTMAGTFTVYTYLGVFIARIAGLGPQFYRHKKRKRVGGGARRLRLVGAPRASARVPLGDVALLIVLI
ncbi:MFS transporter [Bradyrhizobium japonicum]|uniref:MFS transporter n=1 Tax=Bradyrhizobium japonicum TaxID=375 RepID=UPI001BAC254F|nr:MFS transporter [Bradyrhizobium japonicum]MBR0914895.1 MFS transporter [Bradyrhizobium japonicum]